MNDSDLCCKRLFSEEKLRPNREREREGRTFLNVKYKWGCGQILEAAAGLTRCFQLLAARLSSGPPLTHSQTFQDNKHKVLSKQIVLHYLYSAALQCGSVAPYSRPHCGRPRAGSRPRPRFAPGNWPLDYQTSLKTTTPPLRLPPHLLYRLPHLLLDYHTSV